MLDYKPNTGVDIKKEIEDKIREFAKNTNYEIKDIDMSSFDQFSDNQLRMNLLKTHIPYVWLYKDGHVRVSLNTINNIQSTIQNARNKKVNNANDHFYGCDLLNIEDERVVSVGKNIGNNKEATITIQNSSRLSEEEINKMVKDAEENKEADDKRKEERITIIRAESLIHQMEKSITDSKDLDPKMKEQSEKEIASLKEMIEKKQIQELKTKLDQIEQAAAMFANQQANKAASQEDENNDGPIKADVEEKE